MSRYHRYHSYSDGDWVEAVVMLLLAIALIFLVSWCDGPKRDECKARGGVYLEREDACVAPPPSR